MRTLLIFTLSISLLTSSCKNGRENTGNEKLRSVALAPSPASPIVVEDVSVAGESVGQKENISVANPATTVSRKIIKEGEISVEIKNFKDTRKALQSNLSKVKGYIEEESENQGGDANRKEYQFKIRIPAQNFDQFLNSVVAVADHVESKNIRIQDVTTQFIDITTRLNNKKLLEDRYKALLQKATKMADMLEVESKLTDIRTEIEAAQGQLNYLNKQIAYSSLTITFFTKSEFKDNSNSFGYKFKKAFSDSGELLQSLFFGIITLWPVLLLTVLVILLLRKWFKRKSKTII